jgi:hypothetical protein
MDEQGDFWGLLFLLTFHQDKLATVHPKLALNICWPIDVALALYFIDGPAEYLSADGTLPSQNLPAVKVACDQRAAVSSKRHSSPEEEGEVGPQLGNGPAPWCVSRRPLGLGTITSKVMSAPAQGIPVARGCQRGHAISN